MTATINGAKPAADLTQVLARADRRWCTKRADDPADPDYLRHLADALTPHLQDQPVADPTELQELHARVAQLDNQLELAQQDAAGWQASAEGAAAARTELERTLQAERAEHRRALDEARTDLANARVEATRERSRADQLASQLAEAVKHVCSWEISADHGTYLPCSCGRVWPRYAAAERGLDIEPRLSGWDAILARVRAELDGWGAP